MVNTSQHCIWSATPAKFFASSGDRTNGFRWVCSMKRRNRGVQDRWRRRLDYNYVLWYLFVQLNRTRFFILLILLLLSSLLTQILCLFFLLASSVLLASLWFSIHFFLTSYSSLFCHLSLSLSLLPPIFLVGHFFLLMPLLS